MKKKYSPHRNRRSRIDSGRYHLGGSRLAGREKMPSKVKAMDRKPAGGASKAEVIIADEAIHYPKVLESDYLLSMSEKAYEKYNGGMKQNSVLILDTTFVKEVPNEKAAKTIAVPITPIGQRSHRAGNDR